MLAGDVEGVTSKGQRAGRVAQALDVERRDLLLEAALAQQDVLRADIDVFEIELAPVVAADIAGRTAEGEALLPALDKDRADAVHTWAVTHIDQEQVGVRAVGGEDLRTVDAEAVAVRRGGGLQVGDGGTGLGLAHADRDGRLAADQRGEIARLLIVGGVFDEGADRPEIAGLDDVGGARADGGDRLDGDDGVHERAAHAAVLLLEGDAEQPLLRHQLGDV